METQVTPGARLLTGVCTSYSGCWVTRGEPLHLSGPAEAMLNPSAARAPLSAPRPLMTTGSRGKEVPRGAAGWVLTRPQMLL